MKVAVSVVLAFITFQMTTSFIIPSKREVPSCIWYWYPRYPKYPRYPPRGPSTATPAFQSTIPNVGAGVSASAATDATISTTTTTATNVAAETTTPSAGEAADLTT